MKYFAIILFLCFCFQCYTFGNSIYSVNNDECLIDSLFIQARNFISVDDEIAILYLEKCKDKLEKVDNVRAEVEYYLLMSKIAYYRDDYQLALTYLDTVQSYDELNSMTDKLARYYRSKGMVYGCLGNNEKASAWILKSIGIYKQQNNFSEEAMGYNNMGNIYMDHGNLDKSIDYYNKAYQTIQKTSNKNATGKILISLGKYNFEIDNLDKALGYYNMANRYFNECGDLRCIALSLRMIAEIELTRGQIFDAIDKINKSEAIYEKLNEKYGLVLVFIQLSEAYMAINKSEVAIAYADSALSLSTRIKNDPLKAESFYHLSQAFDMNGEIEQAFSAFKQYEALRTGLLSRKNDQRIANLEYQTQSIEKEKEIQLLKQQNKLKTSQLFGLLVSVILFLISAIIIVLLMRIKNANLKQKQAILIERNRIVEVENELKQQKEIVLENEMELKNKELASKALAILQLNETLQNVGTKVNGLDADVNSDNRKIVKGILQEIKMATHNDIWGEFDIAFNQVHNSFYEKIMEVSPNLSSTEIKIAALLKLNLSTKEIAALTFKSESAVKTARHRLRNKIDLPRNESLISFLMKL